MTRADIIDSLEDEYGLLCENLTEREVAIIGHIAKNIRPEEIALLQANDADTGQDKCHIQNVSDLFAEYLKAHEHASNEQKAAASVMWNAFIEAYKR